MQDMRRIYSSCDILLKLSRVEGFFGPPMEMMACGGATVVGRVTGYDEYIVDGQNALVVDALDINAARNAVQRLIDDTTLRGNLIAAGAKTAREWDWESSINTLEKFFAELAADPQSWYDNSPRPKYDRSIAFAYDMMSRSVLPEDIVPVTASTPRKPSRLMCSALPCIWQTPRISAIRRPCTCRLPRLQKIARQSRRDKA